MDQTTARTTGTDRVGIGIAYATGGLFAMSVMDACAKYLGSGYAITQIILFRNGISVAAVLLFVLIGSGGLRRLRFSSPLLMAIRTASGLGAAYLFFSGLRYLPLADAFAIAFAAPLFITTLSVPVLGETVGPRRWAAVVLGFVGVLVILQPGADAFRIEALLPLGAAFCYAMAVLVGRRMARVMPISAIIFWPSLIIVCLTGLMMPSQWRMDSAADLSLFLFLGTMGTAGIILVTQAYRHAPAAAIAPFDYSVLIWGVVFGWVIWNDVPGPNVWLGSAILIGCGLYILHRETRKPKPVSPLPGPLGPTN